MNSGWRVIDCTGLEGSLGYRRGQIIVRKSEPDSEVAIPLAQVAVVLIGSKASVSGAVIMKLSEYDISLLVCDWRQVPVAGAIPWHDHTRVGIRQRSQAELSLPRKKQAWARVISAKIYGQSRTAEAITGRPSPRLNELAGKVRSGDPDNHEARAVRIYWSLISDGQEFSRIPGAGESGWNSALDYAYTLLRGYGIRAITSAGLAGTLGLFHRGRGNAFALVDDLMEPFRPMIDQIVFSALTPEEDLTPSTKQTLSTGITGNFSKDGKTLPTVFNEFAQHYGLYVEGEVKSLQVPRWKGILDASEGH